MGPSPASQPTDPDPRDFNIQHNDPIRRCLNEAIMHNNGRIAKDTLTLQFPTFSRGKNGNRNSYNKYPFYQSQNQVKKTV